MPGLAPIIGGASLIILMLGGALAWKDYQLREADREYGALAATESYNRGVFDATQAKEQAIKQITKEHNAAVRVIETERNEVQNALNLQLATAAFDATNNPIKFFDTFAADILYYDCLWGQGPAYTADRRGACRSEADRANAAGAGLQGTAITPEFREGWTDACDGWKLVGRLNDEEVFYTQEMWEAEFPKFTPDMCRLTVAALSPETARLLVALLAGQTAYTDSLYNFSQSQESVIEQLSAPRPDPVIERP